MPKIYEYFGIVFLFYSHEHLPIHVHAGYNEYETKFEFIYEDGKLVDVKIKKVRGREPLPVQNLKEAEKFVRLYHKQITVKWNEFFVLRKKLKFEKINTRIK